MKTKTLFTVIMITILSAIPAIATGSFIHADAIAEAEAMDQANVCFRAIGSYSKFKCDIFFRNHN